MNEPVQMMLLGDAAEHAEAAIIVWNAERRYVAVNDKACELLGVTREELLDRPVGSTNRSPEAQSAIDAVLEHAPAKGTIAVQGAEVEWVVFPTTIAGLEHVVGIFWPAL
jgi:PAS domain S-box-containing protein